MPEFANSLPPNPNLPRFHRRRLRRLRAAVSLGPIGLFELGGAEAAKRRMRPRPAADCLDAPEQVRRGLLARGAGGRERTGLAMPMRGGGALSARALKWGRRIRANEKGAPARADAPGRDALPALRAHPSHGPGSPARARGPSFPSREAKKEGPAVSGGPLGYPWWSLGGSNP